MPSLFDWQAAAAPAERAGGLPVAVLRYVLQIYFTGNGLHTFGTARNICRAIDLVLRADKATQLHLALA